MAGKQLTGMQKVFALEYIICKNGTEAARRAGYKGDDNVLAVTAHDNLRNPKITAFINERFAETAMRADEVIARISEQAATDMGDFIKIKNGIPFFDLEKAAARNKLHLIQSFENTKNGVKLKLYDAQTAQRTLAQHHGLLKTEITINFPPELLERFGKLAEQVQIPASQLFEDMMNAIAAEMATNAAEGSASVP